jgi:hypothetical protein
MPVTSERAPRIADGRIVRVLGYTLRTDQSPSIVSNSMLISSAGCAASRWRACDSRCRRAHGAVADVIGVLEV